MPLESEGQIPWCGVKLRMSRITAEPGPWLNKHRDNLRSKLRTLKPISFPTR